MGRWFSSSHARWIRKVEKTRSRREAERERRQPTWKHDAHAA
jgi:hypothetical protein